MFQVAIAQFEGATMLRVPPLAAGLLASTLRRDPDLRDVAIEIYAAQLPLDLAAAALAEADLVGISLYTWNLRYSLEVARRAKELRPRLRIIAGGPSVPRRPLEREQFLAAHPWVDTLVLGEGELAFTEVVRAARSGTPSSAIPGVVARDASTNTIAIGPPRARLDNDGFERIGSPYLDGTFDDLVARGRIPPITAVVLETNRGCPFSCTFCDWGQATQSRVVELPLARIERELAWIADRGVSYLYLVDANFGIRRRDVEITRAIGRVSRDRGAPTFVFFHLTKNATANNLRTIEILREHGVGTQVALSMQDFDAEVLTAIRRDNIRPARALALRERCHEKGWSTVNELMLGLPAQTAQSIRRSLNAALTPFPGDSFLLYPTRVLENAELAEPAYRSRYGLETRNVPQWPASPGDERYVVELEELVVATASLSIDAWSEAYMVGYVLSALWNERLLKTTLHVLQFALGIDATSYIDVLMASRRPRMIAVRTELLRFTQAILDARASTLPVEGWGAGRRDPADAVCACVFDDGESFYAEAADEAAALVGTMHATLIRDAVAWDAARALSSGCARTMRFAYDWVHYEAHMGSSPPPKAQPIVARVTPAVRPGGASERVALEVLKHARPTVERLAGPGADPSSEPQVDR